MISGSTPIVVLSKIAPSILVLRCLTTGSPFSSSSTTRSSNLIPVMSAFRKSQPDQLEPRPSTFLNFMPRNLLPAQMPRVMMLSEASPEKEDDTTELSQSDPTKSERSILFNAKQEFMNLPPGACSPFRLESITWVLMNLAPGATKSCILFLNRSECVNVSPSPLAFMKQHQYCWVSTNSTPSSSW